MSRRNLILVFRIAISLAAAACSLDEDAESVTDIAAQASTAVVDPNTSCAIKRFKRTLELTVIVRWPTWPSPWRTLV